MQTHMDTYVIHVYVYIYIYIYIYTSKKERACKVLQQLAVPMQRQESLRSVADCVHFDIELTKTWIRF